MGSTAKAKGQTHDTDLLLASNVSAFRQWLITQGIAITAPDHANITRGVHYWVEVPGCKPVSVQEGFGRQSRYAQTHFRLRPLLNSFLTSPMASAIKEIVRTRPAGPLQTVVGGKVQPAPAANSEVPAILKAHAQDRSRFLLSDADITQALAIDSPIPEGVEVKHVFGVRVAGADRKGMTVVAHMKVYDSPDARRLVEVVKYPVLSVLHNIEHHAEALFWYANALPNATILVDVLGDGLKFFQHLQAFTSPTVTRYGMTMGQALPKGGNGKQFANRRTECSVLAAEAIRNKNMKLLPPYPGLSDPLVLLGSKIPYELTAETRCLVAKPSQIENAKLPTADLFDAICLAFHSVPLPLPTEKSVPACSDPATAPKAPAKPMDQSLIDLRDDFAITCPLVQEHDESLTAFANRRWVYAQAMIDARPV